MNNYLKTMVKYFAYGSNLDTKRMIERGVVFTSRQFGILKDYKLVFNKKSSKNNLKEGYANIVKSKGSIVEGGIYEITEESVLLLDKYESFPKHYIREYIDIEASDRTIRCIVYVATTDKVMDDLKPSKEYFSKILEGKDLFTEEYYNNLIKTELL
jgi:gamma-glutamylcyclotransferase